MIDHKEILLDVLKSYQDADKWDNALYEQIKRISNTKVGDVGQSFIELLCKKLKYSCVFPLNKRGVRAKQSPWDIEINSVKFELKTATEDVSGAFQFNHIRYHRSYDGLICLGITPEEIYFNLWSKADVTTGKAGNLVSMEKEANASYKLTKRPEKLNPIKSFDDKLKDFIRSI